MSSELDFKKVPELIGMEDEMKRMLHMLRFSSVAPYLVGPAGTGKTVFAQNLAKRYAKKVGVKAYYVQGAPETTKTSLIAGLRMQAGSLVAVKSVVAQAAEEGAIVVVDELPHMMQEVILMFNSLLDRYKLTSIGDIMVEAADSFRLVFIGNPVTHAGNVPLPQSFASRLYPMYFDYPSFGQELRVTKSILEATYEKENLVPEYVVRYVVGLYRKYRTMSYPLVARNMSSSIIALNAEVRFAEPSGQEFSIQNEAVALNLCRLAHYPDHKVADVVRVFEEFVGKTGARAFKRCLEQGALVNVDVDTGHDTSARQKLSAAIFTGQTGLEEAHDDEGE